MNWLLLSTNGATANVKSGSTHTNSNSSSSVNSLNEASLLAVLHPPVASVSAYERPSRMAIQTIQQRQVRAALCPGGPVLDPGYSCLWLWAQELDHIKVPTIVPAASGLRRERIQRGSAYGVGPVRLSVADMATQRVVFDTMGTRPRFVGAPSLIPSVICEDVVHDEAVIISLHDTNREMQVDWLTALLKALQCPARILVHEPKEWHYAARLASAVTWAQIINVAEIHDVAHWAHVLAGKMYLGANESEVIGAAALGTPSVLLVPTEKQEVDLQQSAAGALHISQAVMSHGGRVLDPGLILEALTTISRDEARAQVQVLLEWLHDANMPLKLLTVVRQPPANVQG